jgi:hypothetical protein
MTLVENRFDQAGEMPRVEDLTNRIGVDTGAHITQAVDMRGL